MRLLINIPKEFEQHFQEDRFEDSLHRLSADAHLLAGNYEQETAVMLIESFKSAIPVPDHGRLVDADALENFIKKDWDEDDHWIADVVYSRPTIIPADKEEAKKSDSEDLVHGERADRHSRAGRGGDPGNLCMLRGQQPRGGIQ